MSDCFFVHDGQAFKIWTNQDGYPCVTWGRGRDRRPFLLHRLVYLLVHGAIPEGHQIHHLDGDRSNWAPENLQAVTPQAHRAMHLPGRYAQDHADERCAVMETG